MRSISVFNNKGGVGKTTLTFHLAQALGLLGHKVLLIDADPQCNLTIFALHTEVIEAIWEAEDEELLGAIRWQLQQLSSRAAPENANATRAGEPEKATFKEPKRRQPRQVSRTSR